VLDTATQQLALAATREHTVFWGYEHRERDHLLRPKNMKQIATG
jgi:hypothetical protein